MSNALMSLSLIIVEFDVSTSHFSIPKDHTSFLLQGIPISLCAIYSLVCGRLGVLLRGVNAPNHFVLRLDLDKPVFVDAFDAGQRYLDLGFVPGKPHKFPISREKVTGFPGFPEKSREVRLFSRPVSRKLFKPGNIETLLGSLYLLLLNSKEAFEE
jgi:hypothetical protein